MSSIILGSAGSLPMRDVFEIYSLNLDFTIENYRIEVSTFNGDYFRDARSLLDTYGMVFNDFKAYANNKEEKVRLMEFLEDSVENNYYLNDYITKIDFRIKKNHIYFERNGEKEDWINMGEFYIDNYKVNCCSSYMFLTDLKTNEQFMYYGD